MSGGDLLRYGDLALRRAVPADLVSLVALQQAAYAKNRRLLGVEPLPLLADYAAILRDMEVWVGERDGRLAGALILEPRTGDLLIWSIATDPGAQAGGLGRVLLAAAEVRARELGRSVIRLYTGTLLAHLVAWYGRHGYAVERIEALSDRSITHMMKHVECEHGKEDHGKEQTTRDDAADMPGYEFSAKKKGLLSWAWAVERLKKSRQYWIATTRPDGAPHLMIIWGLWLDESFWFSTGSASRKARNLTANPRCVIGTDDAAKAVILEGVVKSIGAKRVEYEQFAKAYEKKYGWDVREMGQPVYRFQPKLGFGLFEKKFEQTATRWSFE